MLLNGIPSSVIISQLSGGVRNDSSFEVFDREFMGGVSIDTSSLRYTASKKKLDKINEFVDKNMTISLLAAPVESKKHVTPHNLRWSRQTEISVFYDRTMIGIYSDSSDLSDLGWGSKKYAAFLARESQLSKNVGRAIICLMRHGGGYAHFVRDIVAKLCWYDKYIEPLSTVDTLITDNKLSQDEQIFIHSLGMNAKIITSSSCDPAQKYTGDIFVFEIGNGSLMLPELSDKIREPYASHNRRTLYLSRGFNARRTLVNEEKLMDELRKAGMM